MYNIEKTAFSHKTLVDCDKLFVFPADSIVENIIVEKAVAKDLVVEIIEKSKISARIKYAEAELKLLNIKNIK